MKQDKFVRNTPLGKSVQAVDEYTPALLCALPRELSRGDLGLQGESLPFFGVDIWNLYELSWLDPGGMPRVAIGQMEVPCDSPALVESKSLKLYLNSLNQGRYASMQEVEEIIAADVSACIAAPVRVKLQALAEATPVSRVAMVGDCLDDIEVAVDSYKPDAGLLALLPGEPVEEQLYSDLFRSCCPVTGQPDWASVSVAYRGRPIGRESLLKYLVSFRQHSGFHEQCVERIFVDIQARCEPERLTVYARFLRRGGIDINPLRTTPPGLEPDTARLVRQ